MRIAIIADDLTGASDTGVHLAKRGLSTAVLMDSGALPNNARQQVAVFDTDSRSVPASEAYARVRRVCEEIRSEPEFGLIYKKIDSTFRGNIGPELDAAYDAFRPDFIAVAPAFPALGRTVKDGVLYINGAPLHETDASRDPNNPIGESRLTALLKRQTEREVRSIGRNEWTGGSDRLAERLRECAEQNIPYLLFDSETEEDLQRIAELVDRIGYKVLWAGSAGLANALADLYFRADAAPDPCPETAPGPVLLAVGSVSGRSRLQLEAVLKRPDVRAIKLNPANLLAPTSRQAELACAALLASTVYCRETSHIVLYSAGSPEDVAAAMKAGERNGMTAAQVSSSISGSLGEAAARIVRERQIRKLVLTGGDTARQVCLRLGAKRLELLGELETGVPFGRLALEEETFVITKAGGFGSDRVLNEAIEAMSGGVRR